MDTLKAAAAANAMPAQEYSLRAPSPPHINIPPIPEMTVLKLPESSPSPADLDVPGEAACKALQFLTSGQYETASCEWAYDNRREAQQILPFLYLGPFVKAKDVDFLVREGITMLIVVRDEKSALSGLLSGQKAADKLGIPFVAIDVAGSKQLIKFGFNQAIHSINNHLVQRFQACAPNEPLPAGPPFVDEPPTFGKVYVYCESGNDRSAAVISAYLMAMYQVSLVSSLQYVQARRFCIALKDDLKNVLLSFHELLEARRAVAGDAVGTGGMRQIRKRSIDEVDNEDAAAAALGDASRQHNDAARFASRDSAPFRG